MTMMLSIVSSVVVVVVDTVVAVVETTVVDDSRAKLDCAAAIVSISLFASSAP